MMKRLFYLILGIMGLLFVVIFFSWMLGSTESVPSGASTIVISSLSTPVSGVTSVTSKDPLPEIGTTVPPGMFIVTAQAAQTSVISTATAQTVSDQQVATATQMIVSAQQAVEAQMLQSLLTADPTAAKAHEAQRVAASANEEVSIARSTEIAAAATYEAYVPTATMQARAAATQQVKAFAMATATVKAAQAELAAVQAKVQSAEKSLKEMKAMGLDTSGALATLQALEDQAQRKLESLKNSQISSQTWPDGSGYGLTGTTTYIVQLGDTWYSIAQRFGLRAEELAAANGMPVTLGPYVGQSLIIHSPYVPQPQPQPVPMPMPGGMFYVVQPKDTLFSIARRFGVSLIELASANQIVDYNRIWVGQRLVIPVPGPYPSYPSYPPGLLTPTPSWWPTPAPTSWWPTSAPTSWWPTPTSVAGNDVYNSTDGRFSVQYPRAWSWGTDVPAGYVMFWSRTMSSPSVGFAIFAKSSGVWRPAREVLDSYKAQLGSQNLMNAIWGPVSYSWDGRVDPYTLGGQLSMGELGYAQSNRVLARATARNDGTREYLALIWAQSDQWDAQRATLDQLINTLALDN